MKSSHDAMEHLAAAAKPLADKLPSDDPGKALCALYAAAIAYRRAAEGNPDKDAVENVARDVVRHVFGSLDSKPMSQVVTNNAIGELEVKYTRLHAEAQRWFCGEGIRGLPDGRDIDRALLLAYAAGFFVAGTAVQWREEHRRGTAQGNPDAAVRMLHAAAHQAFDEGRAQNLQAPIVH